MSRILILGASGLLGGKVLTRLLDAAPQAEVVAGARRRDWVASHAGRQVPVLHVDYDNPDSVHQALARVDRLFVVTGGPEGPSHDETIAAAAAAAGIAHVVKISALGVHEGATDPISTWHRAGEAAFVEAGLSCSFLRPGAFMSNALMWAPAIQHGAEIPLVEPHLPVACVNPDDIADIAAHLLLNPQHGANGYPITGPETISPRDQVTTLADTLGQELTWREVTTIEAADLFTAYGMPPPLASAVAATMASPRHGIGNHTYPTVDQLLRRPPRTFTQWTHDCQTTFHTT